jgi:ABC-type sugar transport system substrate-binding protein
MALVRYLSTGDFFESYLAGAKEQAEALGVDLQVFDSRQDAERQAEMVDQAIALGVDGIIIQHGPTDLLKAAAQRAVDAGIKVVAFNVNVENDKIPQIEQFDRQLGDQTGLLVFGEGTGDLAHHLPRRVVARGQIIPRGREQPHASANQEGDAQLLGDQLACKPAGILDDDGAHAVALDAVKERREARSVSMGSAPKTAAS